MQGLNTGSHNGKSRDREGIRDGLIMLSGTVLSWVPEKKNVR